MGLSDGHLFLMAADPAATAHDYFQWRAVGRRLEWAEAKSRQVLITLGCRKLVIVLHREETRLLPAGRKLAQELRLQEARHTVRSAPHGTRDARPPQTLMKRSEQRDEGGPNGTSSGAS